MSIYHVGHTNLFTFVVLITNVPPYRGVVFTFRLPVIAMLQEDSK